MVGRTFLRGEVTVCGVIDTKSMGWLVLVIKWVHFSIKMELTGRARNLYDMTPKKGPLRWIEAQLATRGDLEAFMSLVDGKLRAYPNRALSPKMGHHTTDSST